jgi:hypothetical protein
MCRVYGAFDPVTGRIEFYHPIRIDRARRLKGLSAEVFIPIPRNATFEIKSPANIGAEHGSRHQLRKPYQRR